MAVTEKIIINELLCFLSNNFSNSNKNTLKSTISTFFHEKEIVDVKNVLFDIASEVKAEIDTVSPGWIKSISNTNTGRLISRRGGEGHSKEMLDTEDILYIFSLLDISKVSLPIFVAKNLARIPPALFEI